MLTHHNIKAYIEDGELTLQQAGYCGEDQTVYLSADQLLQIADKVRGITRPDPEAEQSRKLRVVADRMSEIVCDEAFRTALLDGQRYTDWLEKIDALDDLLWEYAYGLRPSREEPPATAQKPQGDLTAKGRTDNQQAKENASDIAETMPLPNL